MVWHLEKFSLNFSSPSFVIRVNLLHPYPSLLLYALSLSLWCFSILVNYSFQVSFNLKAISYVAKITQNDAVTKKGKGFTNHVDIHGCNNSRNSSQFSI